MMSRISGSGIGWVGGALWAKEQSDPRRHRPRWKKKHGAFLVDEARRVGLRRRGAEGGGGGEGEEVDGEGGDEDGAPPPSEQQQCAPLYDLYGVVHHLGTMGGGHYVATCQPPSSGNGDEEADVEHCTCYCW